MGVQENTFATWDRGEYTYNPVEQELLKLQGGQKLGEKVGQLLSSCTVCPVGNATCEHYLEFIFVGFHPEKGCKKHTMMICGLGIEDIDHCPLSK